MPIYPYTTRDRLAPQKWLPGTAPYAAEYDEFVREYANASGATKATGDLTLTLALGAAPGDKFTVTIFPEGAVPFQVPVTVPDPRPADGAETQQMLRDAIADNVFINGFATFTATATSVDFESLQVSQRLTISSDIKAAVGTLAVNITNGQPIGAGIAPGRFVLKDNSATYAAIGWENPGRVAFLPNGALSGTQQIAGVVMRDRDEYAIEPLSFPMGRNTDYSNVNMPSLRVKESKHVVVELESALTGAMPTQIFYRHTADGLKTQLGIAATAAGTGLSVLPKEHEVVEIRDLAAVIRLL